MNTRELVAPPERVTVFEDRAQVRRTVRLELPAGLHCLCVDRVTPLVVDRSLRGSVAAGWKLRQVRVRRCSTVAASRPELERELAAEIERWRQSFLIEHDTQRAAEAQQRLLERSFSDWLQVCALEAGRGQPRGAEWQAGLHRIEERLKIIGDEVRRARETADEIAERLEQLGERQFLAMQPTSLYWGQLEAVVEVEEGGAGEVAWDYLVPCALWRPAHQAELNGELRWTLTAMIWQRTGEDWPAVSLSLSTARPTAGAKLPLLEEDNLRLRPKTEAEQSSVRVESRDEVVSALLPSASGGALQVPGVEDGGEVRRFELPGPVLIPSDGRAHLVELGSFSTPATLDRICYPEISAQVQLRSRQTNTGQHPLLAGPVTLVRDGGFAGRSLVGFAASGEPFELGWGTLEHLQVVRRNDDHEEDLSLGRGTRRRCRVRLFLSNTSNRAERLQVVERIPVSELGEVRVKVIEAETSPGARPDGNGHLRWELELPAHSHRELSLVYEIEATRRVVWS